MLYFSTLAVSNEQGHLDHRSQLFLAHFTVNHLYQSIELSLVTSIDTSGENLPVFLEPFRSFV